MNNAITILFAGSVGAFVAAGATFAFLLLSACFWAFAYAFLGWTFPETMLAFQKSLGLAEVAPWQVGVMAGWISTIFKNVVTVNK